MKRTLAMCLMGILLIVALSACGKKTSPAVGTWSLKEATTMDVTEFLEASETGGQNLTITMKEDGSFSSDLGEDSDKGTWKLEKEALTVTNADGDTLTGTVSDGKLTLSLDGVDLVFTK